MQKNQIPTDNIQTGYVRFQFPDLYSNMNHILNKYNYEYSSDI